MGPVQRGEAHETAFSPRAEEKPLVAGMDKPKKEPPVSLDVRIRAVEPLIPADQRENLLQLLPADRTHLDVAHRR
jgi:hypothetical protein